MAQETSEGNFLIIPNEIRPLDGKPMQSTEVFQLMMLHECWEYSSTSKVYPRIKPGDRFVFYLAGMRARYFAGEARVAGPPVRIADGDCATFDRDQVPYFTWRLPLAEIRRYQPGPKQVELIRQLSFARESTVPDKYIGLLLRNGICTLTPEDVDFIRSKVKIENGS